jgi:CarD family transcriptional regulator
MAKTALFGPIIVDFRSLVVYTHRVVPSLISLLPPATCNGGNVNFQVGDKVIYPNHGLGIVERVEEKTILGTTCGFFHLRIVSNDTTVLVPVANVDGVGLRKAITDEEVERLFELLSDGRIDNHQNWKGRFKDNSDKMRTGSIYDMADVLKSLTFLSKSKSLSFREKRMLDRAKALIISEVSEVMREKALEIEQQVDMALEKCFTAKARNVARATVRTKVVKTTVKAVVLAPAAAPRRAARAS